MDFKNHVITIFWYSLVQFTCRCRCKTVVVELLKMYIIGGSDITVQSKTVKELQSKLMELRSERLKTNFRLFNLKKEHYRFVC